MNFSKRFLGAFGRKGIPLSGSGEIMDGRTVVRGIEAPVARVDGTIAFERWDFEIKSGSAIIKKQSFVDMHFIGCRFSDVGFFNVQFQNCIFEKCSCKGMGFWESTIENCKFIGSDLRETAMGGHDMFAKHEKVNCYENVEFERCDMRGSAHSNETYRSCLFNHCRLDGVLFMGAVLENCRFVRKLKVVEFRDFDLSPAQNPKNRLAGCDFREAELIDCQFIGIGLDPELFPKTDDWIVLPNGPTDLLRWKELTGIENFYVDHITSLAGTPTLTSRSSLGEVGITPEQVVLLEEIAAGRA